MAGGGTPEEEEALRTDPWAKQPRLGPPTSVVRAQRVPAVQILASQYSAVGTKAFTMSVRQQQNHQTQGCLPALSEPLAAPGLATCYGASTLKSLPSAREEPKGETGISERPTRPEVKDDKTRAEQGAA